MEKKRILFIPSTDQGGVWYYRVLTPMRALSQSGQFDVTIDGTMKFTDYEKDKIGKSYDLVWIHNCTYPHDIQDEAWKMIVYCKRTYGTKFVLDIDDYWDYGKLHPANSVCQFNAFPEKMMVNFKLFDYVTTTTEHFKKVISRYFPEERIVVLENAISLNDTQFHSEKTSSDKVRIGLVGGASHTTDIECLMGFWKYLPSKVIDKIEVVLCGYDTKNATKVVLDENGDKIGETQLPDSENWWVQTEKRIVTGVGKEHYRRIETKDISKGEFGPIYDSIDVILVPLKNTKFNNCKSELKFIEAGFTSTAIIASRVVPYSNFGEDHCDCLLVKDNTPEGWAKKIKMLVNDDDMRLSMAQMNRQRIMSERNLEKITGKRISFLNRALSAE